MPEINYALLKSLAEKPHPLLNIAEDFEEQLRLMPTEWVGEVFTEARTAHHLLDLAGIPQRDRDHVYASDLDSRTWLAVAALSEARVQLAEIAAWHVQETADGGMVGSDCAECGWAWPCRTRRMADGAHEDLTEETPADAR